MGLIKAITGAAGGVLADQWKEFFYCDALAPDVLVTKGQKQITSRSSNTKGNDNIISNGSGIAVADGQCMIIVEQGKVVEVCAEPGQFTYNSSTEPSIFAGSLGTSILDTFKAIGRRFTYGGDTGKDQRVYYFNTKEIIQNPFGTSEPIPFRVVDNKIGLDVDVTLTCNGYYTYKITNPLLFYTNVCGNVESEYNKSVISADLKADLINHLQVAFAELSNEEIRPNQIIANNTKVRDALKEILAEEWGNHRGITLEKVSFRSVTVPKEDLDMIKTLQKTAVFQNASMGAAHLVQAQGQAMQDAAKNSAGAMTGFMGMGFAQNAGGGTGMNVSNLYAMGEQQKAQKEEAAQAAAAEEAAANAWECACGAKNTGKFCQNCGAGKPEPKAAPAAGGWKCDCGAENTGKFCTNCGNTKPADNSWTCECGTSNMGKFCPQCGKAKPAGTPTYQCDKCGWIPEDPKNPPKFCPECGDVFDENDAK